MSYKEFGDMAIVEGVDNKNSQDGDGASSKSGSQLNQ